MVYQTFLLLLLVVLTSLSPSKQQESCSWSTNEESDKTVVYWINMDKSSDRRLEMELQFNKTNIRNERIRGITLDEIYIPKDVRLTWMSKQAIYQTQEPLEPYLSSPPSSPSSSGASSTSKIRVFLSSLYGRRRLNRLAELGCTISHLLAMRHAIYNNQTTSRYAVITEDDVYFPFAIDWQAMAQSAPQDFGILQLFNSNQESMRTTFNDYRKSMRRDMSNRKYWHERFPKQPGSFWSTCAYLIDRHVLKPVIDSIITEYHKRQSPSVSLFDMKIIAGIRWECIPVHSPCCINPINYTYRYIPLYLSLSLILCMCVYCYL